MSRSRRRGLKRRVSRVPVAVQNGYDEVESVENAVEVEEENEDLEPVEELEYGREFVIVLGGGAGCR